MSPTLWMTVDRLENSLDKAQARTSKNECKLKGEIPQGDTKMGSDSGEGGEFRFSDSDLEEYGAAIKNIKASTFRIGTMAFPGSGTNKKACRIIQASRNAGFAFSCHLLHLSSCDAGLQGWVLRNGAGKDYLSPSS